MINIIVMGHGGYAEGIKNNLRMLSGEPEYMHFLDLTPESDLNTLETNLNTLLEKIGDQDVLFSCDLFGASPFRVAAMKCMANPGRYMLVTGLNTMAYVELSMPSELSLEGLAKRSVETTKDSVKRFPE
ncbi:MAG: PTS system fructose subfamily transporter subunit IIA [Tepidanaerobacteraceae bacterium]|nr:PTS system fructose subfamily transporter subunit IIA [Tepidanaerobacteraceae bacterium]